MLWVTPVSSSGSRQGFTFVTIDLMVVQGQICWLLLIPKIPLMGLLHSFFQSDFFFFFCQVTPLHVAAEGGYVNIVEFLIEGGAEIDVKDNTDVSISLLAGPTLQKN